MKNTHVLLILSFFGIFSCEKPKNYSDIPEVEFVEFNIINDLSGEKYLESIISFIDGDGDICYPVEDTIQNLIYTLYEYKNDSLIEIIPLVPFHYSIPFYEPEGQNKTMKGKIKTKFFLEDLEIFDTIRFDFYVFDRANNISNKEFTDFVFINEL